MQFASNFELAVFATLALFTLAGITMCVVPFFTRNAFGVACYHYVDVLGKRNQQDHLLMATACAVIALGAEWRITALLLAASVVYHYVHLLTLNPLMSWKLRREMSSQRA